MKIDELIDKKEVASRLGIGQRALDSMMKAKKFPFYRLSRKTVRFNWSDVERALSAYCVEGRR